MMVLSEMVRSRSSSFKRSFRKKSQNNEQPATSGKSSCTRQPVSGGELKSRCSQTFENL